MFVPRALRLKGVKEPKKPSKKTAAPDREIDNPKRGPRYTTKAITPEYLGYLICGMEMIFTDYAHQDKDGAAWLAEHVRDVDGEGKFVHLSAILENPNISSLKPEANHKLLQQALQEQPSTYLELSKSSYFVRRRPSTYPLHFIPNNSFEVSNDDGLSFWDQRTIYVEPHTRDLCKTPAKVAYWLREHGGMRNKWLPIQAVKMLYNSCAFVVLSGNVTHESTWQKWRDSQKPEYWKVMTKVDHIRRTNEYVALLHEERPDLAVKDKTKVQDSSESTDKKRKRNHKFFRGRKRTYTDRMVSTPQPTLHLDLQKANHNFYTDFKLSHRNHVAKAVIPYIWIHI